jgi:transposase
MTREYGRALRGERVVEHIPRQRGLVTTIVASLCCNGIEAVCTYEGGTSGDRFLHYVQEYLGPCLKPGDVVIWDGLAAHKDHRVRAFVETCGARIIRLPPYSPDLNPIEFAWSLVKQWLRTAKVRSGSALPAAVRQACASVSAEVASAFIRHCGYGAR